MSCPCAPPKRRSSRRPRPRQDARAVPADLPRATHALPPFRAKAPNDRRYWCRGRLYSRRSNGVGRPRWPARRCRAARAGENPPAHVSAAVSYFPNLSVTGPGCFPLNPPANQDRAAVYHGIQMRYPVGILFSARPRVAGGGRKTSSSCDASRSLSEPRTDKSPRRQRARRLHRAKRRWRRRLPLQHRPGSGC